MAGKLAIKKNDIEEAKNVFEALLALKRGRRDMAMVQFEYSKIEDGMTQRNSALELFNALYNETPAYAYLLKIKELNKTTTESL